MLVYLVYEPQVRKMMKTCPCVVKSTDMIEQLVHLIHQLIHLGIDGTRISFELRVYLLGVITIRSNMEEIRIHLHAFLLFGEAMANVPVKHCKAISWWLGPVEEVDHTNPN